MDDTTPGTDASITSRRTPGLSIENPFNFKVGQVFTGFGVGCGVGIGVGRPIYLGAIPALQQVMSATRGATDVFSGAGRHINTYLKRIGAKNIEVGVGCGVGIGHGFGVGIALRSGVICQIKSSLMKALAMAVSNFHNVLGENHSRNFVPGKEVLQHNASNGNLKTSIGSLLQLQNQNVATGAINLESDGRQQQNQSHSEVVIRNFLQNPLMKNEEEMQLNDLATKIQHEKSMLQVLLKHQQLIEDLMKDNEMLHQIHTQDQKIPVENLTRNMEASIKPMNPCETCFDCRRRNRNRPR